MSNVESGKGSNLAKLAEYIAVYLSEKCLHGALDVGHIPTLRGQDATRTLLVAAFGPPQEYQFSCLSEATAHHRRRGVDDGEHAEMARHIASKIGSPLYIEFLEPDLPFGVDAAICRLACGPIVRALRGYDAARDVEVTRADVRVLMIAQSVAA